jgi:hypothetical protein
METDGLEDGQWQRKPVGSRSSGKGRTERTEAEGTGNPRTCSEKHRVTCKGNGNERDRLGLAARNPVKGRDETDAERTAPVLVRFLQFKSSGAFHLRVLLRPTCHLSRTAVLLLRLIVLVSF